MDQSPVMHPVRRRNVLLCFQPGLHPHLVIRQTLLSKSEVRGRRWKHEKKCFSLLRQKCHIGIRSHFSCFLTLGLRLLSEQDCLVSFHYHETTELNSFACGDHQMLFDGRAVGEQDRRPGNTAQVGSGRWGECQSFEPHVSSHWKPVQRSLWCGWAQICCRREMEQMWSVKLFNDHPLWSQVDFVGTVAEDVDAVRSVQVRCVSAFRQLRDAWLLICSLE